MISGAWVATTISARVSLIGMSATSRFACPSRRRAGAGRRPRSGSARSGRRRTGPAVRPAGRRRRWSGRRGARRLGPRGEDAGTRRRLAAARRSGGRRRARPARLGPARPGSAWAPVRLRLAARSCRTGRPCAARSSGDQRVGDRAARHGLGSASGVGSPGRRVASGESSGRRACGLGRTVGRARSGWHEVDGVRADVRARDLARAGAARCGARRGSGGRRGVGRRTAARWPWGGRRFRACCAPGIAAGVNSPHGPTSPSTLKGRMT